MTKTDKPLYPWAELYDLESGVKQLPQRHIGMGRPHKPISRAKTSITLTDDERRIIEKLTYLLKIRLHPGKVARNQVMGLALRLLEVHFEALPDNLNNWVAVADKLFGEE